MSIRWIRNVLVEGKKTTLEILLGDKSISDKCYVRINTGNEHWFSPSNPERNAIIAQGCDILQNMLKGKEILRANGQPFNWE